VARLPHARVFALTATASARVIGFNSRLQCNLGLSVLCFICCQDRVQIAISLRMRGTDTVEIVLPVTRPDLLYCQQRVRSLTPATLRCIVDLRGELLRYGPRTTRTLIFVQSIQLGAEVYQYFWFGLGKQLLVDPGQRSTALVQLYHKDSEDEVKALVRDLLDKDADDSNPLRVVIATSALAYGVNMKGVSRVIFCGSPFTIADLAQMAGRAGRNLSTVCMALLLYQGHGGRYVDEAMRGFLDDPGCIRQKLRAYFDGGNSVTMYGETTSGRAQAAECCSSCTPSVLTDQNISNDDDSHGNFGSSFGSDSDDDLPVDDDPLPLTSETESEFMHEDFED